MNYTYVPLPLVEEAQSVSASAQVLVIDDGEVKRTDAANIGIKPTGKLTLTNTTETDCTNYAAVQIVDANLLAENIKKDVTILGTTGSYEGGGSSDLSTAEVTVVAGTGTILFGATYGASFIFGGMEFYSQGDYSVLADAEQEIPLPSNGYTLLYGLKAYSDQQTEISSPTITVSGNITYDSEEEMFYVTGDGTITITAST